MSHPPSRCEELRAQADAAYRAGRLDQALGDYQELATAAPEDAWAHSRIGAILAQQGDLDGAERALKRALELDPDLGAAHSNLGNVAYTRGRYDEAIQHYERAVARDPQNPIFYDNLHAALKKQGNLTRAVSVYKQARRLERQRARPADQPGGRAGRPRGCGLTVALTAFMLLAVLSLVWRQ